MTDHRVTRGRASQVLVAEWFQGRGWPDAASRPASLPGTDITGMPYLAPEVKATANFDMMGSVRQAVRNAIAGDLAFVVYRPKGYGPERIKEWPVVLRLQDFTDLLQQAGYNPA